MSIFQLWLLCVGALALYIAHTADENTDIIAVAISFALAPLVVAYIVYDIIVSVFIKDK